MMVFDYQISRSGQHAANYLQDWSGTLMVNDYSDNKALFANGVRKIGYWAHAQRKFFELHAAGGHPVAAEELQRIARLYTIEEQAKAQTTEQGAQSRALNSQPELQSLHDWLLKLQPNVANGGGLTKVINYTSRRWPALVNYAETGDLSIDNNPIENAIRPIATREKN